MIQHIGHLFGNSVLVQRYWDRADHLRGDHGPVQLRAVAADDGNEVTFIDTKFQQTQRNCFDFIGGFRP